MAAEEGRMSELEANFAADFRDGEAMAREWIAGKGALPELTLIIKDMPRDLGGLEAGFLTTIDAAVRGDRRGAAVAPDPAAAQVALTPPAHTIDELRRRQRERAQRARLDELCRANSALPVGYLPKEWDL
jgi:hypothetical protein